MILAQRFIRPAMPVLWACFSLSAVQAWAKPGSALDDTTPSESLITRIQLAAQSLSFTGTYVHQHDSHLNTLKIIQLKDGKSVVTKIQAMEGRRQEVLRTPAETRIYMPDQKMVRIDDVKSARPAFPSMFLGSGADVLRYYDLVRGKPTRIADIETLEFTLKPKDNLRWPVRIYADPNTGLLIKCQKLDFEGGVIEQVAFSDLDLSPNIKASLLSPSYAGHQEWPVRDASMKPLANSHQLKFKPETLKGFVQIGAYQREDEASPLRFSLRRYVFTDGVATVSVFVQPKGSAGPAAEGINRRGALSLTARANQDVTMTIMGEIPPETLRNFAQSIDWKNAP
jgi:sigma-E factor negative regulatory protein RseB